jgi:hypothetical protein
MINVHRTMERCTCTSYAHFKDAMGYFQSAEVIDRNLWKESIHPQGSFLHPAARTIRQVHLLGPKSLTRRKLVTISSLVSLTHAPVNAVCSLAV